MSSPPLSLVDHLVRGKLLRSGLEELTNELYLHGVVEHDHGEENVDGRTNAHGGVNSSGRPSHVPVALEPSRVPRAPPGAANANLAVASFRHLAPTLDALCQATLTYLARVARDYSFLRETLGPAAGDELTRGESEPRLKRMLEVLNEREAAEGKDGSRVIPCLSILRTDFLMEYGTGLGPSSTPSSSESGVCMPLLRQVETNTISAAFSCAAGVVQRMHARMASALNSSSAPSPDYDASFTIPQAIVSAHRIFNKSAGDDCTQGRRSVVLFVVLEDEHLMCENLMEIGVRRQGVEVESLTLHGCAERLYLEPKKGPEGSDSKERPLLVLRAPTNPDALATSGSMKLPDSDLAQPASQYDAIVSVVYFRAGITPSCWGYDCDLPDGDSNHDRWDMRKQIEFSRAIKVPDAGWWIAGTKVVQARLSEPAVMDRFGLSDAEKQLLQMAMLQMVPVDASKAVHKSLNGFSENFVLKKEPLGIWVGDDMVQKLTDMEAKHMASPRLVNYRDHILMPKIHAPATDHQVTFIRDHRIVHMGSGIQEIGVYGTYFSPGGAFEKIDEMQCKTHGFLVRTKPEHEPDGGVCKGIAVLDSLVW
eukprot:TRINITY_DN77632_c0_g1_i1.p1 TRINITY_DN77632_c0_g1~~TRINITY_DN77632_c0_g1_i1.p1  ORF type:complete len:593 (-),score=34.70 TRINITY_DN77632_c0_g1_i1:8-1786(-)